MKHSVIRALALLLCCALLCGCGGKKQSETVHLPQQSETPAPALTPVPVPTATPLPMTEAEQRVFIEHSRHVWQPENMAYETWYYAITDLDHNGRLEVITASLQGTGLFTWGSVWEMNESCTGLVRCPDDTAEGMAWPDIIRESLPFYRDPASGRYTYVCEDLTRDGATRYVTAQESFSLDHGQISVRVLSVMEEIYSAENASTKTYYNGSNQPISEQDYSSVIDRAFAGQEQGTLSLSWTQLEAQSAQQPQVSPQQQGYNQQGYNQQQGYQTTVGGPVTITKNPTSETLAVGGKTWFIAHADNAARLTWILTSPQGQTYTLQEAMYANPGLQLQELENDTLAVSNVPISADGWSFQARFDGPGGSAVTSPAILHVNDFVTAYGSVISQYYYAYTNGITDPAFAWDRGISEYFTYSSHAGYALQDLSGDGVPELIIAGAGDNNNSGGVIYEIDTLVNGQPVQLACSSARNRYLLRTDGSVLNEGSGGAGHSLFILNRVIGSELVPIEAVFTWFDGQPNDGYYHQSDGYRYEPHDYDEYLTEEQFNYFVGLWEETVTLPALTLIA